MSRRTLFLAACGGVFLAISASAALAQTQPPPASQPAPMVTGNLPCVQPAVTGLKVVSSNWPDATSLRQFGLDAIRLEGAKTDEQKALAIWRWVRRVTMAARFSAREPNDRYISDPSIVLNVYGAHHCDGLSRLMAAVWQAAAGLPAEKLYRAGHTMAECWWPDADGVGRWHMFDVNYGYFLYTRDGSRIVSADDIGADFSLECLPSRTSRPWLEKQWWMYSAIHCVWDTPAAYDGTISLRAGEWAERMWGRGKMPFQANALPVGPRPDAAAYPAGNGNGSFIWRENLDGAWRDRLAVPPINAVVKDRQLGQDDPSRPAELVYRGRFPYVVAGMALDLRTVRAGRVQIETSVDAGRSWQSAWDLKAAANEKFKLDLATVQPCYPPGQESSGRMSRASVIGRYDYLLRLRLSDGAALSPFLAMTAVQLNYLVLPNLVPGNNRITISGNLAPGQAVGVTYRFDDAEGKDKSFTVHAESLPFSYTIPAAGKTWTDVLCRAVEVLAVAADGKGDRVLSAPPAPKALPGGPIPALDIRVLNSITPEAYVLQPKEEQDRYTVTTYQQAWAANKGPFEPKLKSAAQYIADLASPNEDVRRYAAAGLTVLRDASAWAALEKVAIADASRAKYYAVQALFWTDANRAWPMMEKILKRDPSVAFAPDVRDKTEAPTHLNVSAMVAALCGRAKIGQAVPLICEVLAKQSGQWPETRWAMLRALGRIGDPAAIPIVRKYLKGPSDPSVVAMEALIELGDRESIPVMVDWLGFKGHTLRVEAALIGLVRFKAAGHAEAIAPLLSHPREYRRALAADALAVSGQPDIALPALKAAVEKETFDYARQRMQAAIKALGGGA